MVALFSRRSPKASRRPERFSAFGMKNSDEITVHLPDERKEIFARLAELRGMKTCAFARHVINEFIDAEHKSMVDQQWAFGEGTVRGGEQR